MILNNRWLKNYYLATPLFWFIDEVWGISIRAAALDGHPWLKGLYYLFCLACTYLIFRTPWSGVVSLVESSLNLIMLFVGFCYPYFAMMSRFDPEVPLHSPFTPMYLVNFVLSTTMAIIALHRVRLTGVLADRRF